ncbi:hypothetical protein FDECE_13353 [Fusarium decemcellulare]|nr:hypothetical protein FDECE_13353 [Fusarium decemcellulare]
MASGSGPILDATELVHTVVTSEEPSTPSWPLLKPQPRSVDSSFTYLHFHTRSTSDRDLVEVCADTSCGRPMVKREWLNTLEHTIEKRTPTFVSEANDTAGKLNEDWAIFNFFVDGVHVDGTDVGASELICGAWIQDGGSASSPAALLGNEWMVSLRIDVLNTKSRLHVTTLDDFPIPFEVVRSRRKVTRRVNAARATTVPARETCLVPTAWKDVPKVRSFKFCDSAVTAANALVDHKTPPGVVVVNNTKEDTKFHRKQKLWSIEECGDVVPRLDGPPVTLAEHTSRTQQPWKQQKKDASSSAAVFLTEEKKETPTVLSTDDPPAGHGAESEAFKAIQSEIRSGRMLSHLDPKKRLFLQLNGSVECDFGAVLFHVNEDYVWKEGTHIQANVVLPIAFTSKTRTRAVICYDPTELEVACLVQENFVPNGLSRLKAPETDPNLERQRPDYTALEDVLVGIEAMMADDMKERFQQGYLDDTKYIPILRMILNQDGGDAALTMDRSRSEDATSASKRGVPFLLKEGLLYHDKVDGYLRLCVPHALVDDMLKMAHDDTTHFGTERMRMELSGLSINNLTYRAKSHIHGRRTCCLGHTDRQQRIGNCLPIRTPMSPTHTITIGFITDLPPVPSIGTRWAIDDFNEFDQLPTVTCAASKRNLLIPGHSTCKAHHWATALAHRDSKFTYPFWRQLWKDFGTRLAMTTTYHPEADGLSERRNQTVEIALRFYYIENPHADWTHLWPSLQWNVNDALNAGTNTSAHEYIYGFKPQGRLESLTPVENNPGLPYLKEAIRRDARLAVDFATMKRKQQYDEKHRPITPKEGEPAYLRPQSGYHLPGRPPRKWPQQRTGPFRFKRVVNDVAYELELPEQWRIHPVISLRHLQLAHADDYREPEPGALEEGSHGGEQFEVDFIVRREVRRRGRSATPFEGFIVRWKDWGPEHDQWVKTEDIAKDLVDDFRQKHPGEFEGDGLRKKMKAEEEGFVRMNGTRMSK